MKMDSHIHAKNSVKKWGGNIYDYMPIHDFMDSSKAHIADMRHRALLHSAFGCFLVERVFGDYETLPDGKIVKASYITNSDGKKVGVRDIAEQHIYEDMGWIPSVTDYFKHMKQALWFSLNKNMFRKLINNMNEEADEEKEKSITQ